MLRKLPDNISNWRFKDNNGKTTKGANYSLVPVRVYSPHGSQMLLEGRADAEVLESEYQNFIRLLCKEVNALWLFNPDELIVFYLKNKQWCLAM